MTPVVRQDAPAGQMGLQGGPARDGRRTGRVLILTDAVSLLVALPIAHLLLFLATDHGGLPGGWQLPIVLTALPFLAAFGLHDPRRRIRASSIGDILTTAKAMAVWGFAALLVLHAGGWSDAVMSDGEVLAAFLAVLLTVPLGRAVVRRLVLSRMTGRQRVLIIGAGWVGQSVARKIAASPDLNLEVVGFIDGEPQPRDADVDHVPVLGGEDELVAAVRAYGIERVIITFSRTSPERLVEIMRWSNLDRLYVTIVPRFFEVMTSSVELDDISGIPVLDLRPARLSRGALVVKRATDLTLTILAMPLLLPVFAAIALAIKLDSRGPVFFRQLRMGHRGKPFLIYKFRTMISDAEARRVELLHLNELTGPLFKIREDPRVTRVGRFLRRTSLDELPQLINVLRGQMSLVGPRPFVTYEDREIQGWARRRLDLVPGITGIWQVLGRNDIPFEEMVKLDYLYVTRWSLGWDLRLLFQTIPTVLRRRGAY